VLDFVTCAARAVDFRVAAFQRGAPAPTEFGDACDARGIALDMLWERRRFDARVLARAARVAREFAPDIVQTHGYKADCVGLYLRRHGGARWVAFSHGWTHEGPAMRLYRALDERVLVPRADRVVAVSDDRRRALVAAGCRPERVVTVRNAVAPPAVRRAGGGDIRHELGVPADHALVAVIGRLSPEKGQRAFVGAMAAVARGRRAVTGLIVGDGPDEAALRAAVAREGLSNRIRFTGHRRDLDRIYPELSAVVIPSLSEGLPNVLLESMAHGCPVVTTDVGGVTEVVQDGLSAVVVPAGDVEGLAGGLTRVLVDAGFAAGLAARARERVAAAFSVESRARQILAVYRALVSAPRPDTRRTSETPGRTA
jgi:glycosyltransferase involved in cell wall biosynthesis